VKLLVTASTLPRWAGDAVPAFVLEQAVALRAARRGLEVEILAPHHAGAAAEELMQGIPVRRFRYFWPASLERLAYPAILPNLRGNGWLWLQVPFLLLFECVAIFRRCRASRPDVLYSHWFAPQALAGALVARALGIPHVFTTHSSDVEVLGRVPLAGPAIVRAVVRRAAASTAVSGRTRAKLEAFFAPAERERLAPRVRVVPMGIDLAALPPVLPGARAAMRAGLGVADRAVVLFLGRLTEKKGLVVLLEAFAALARAEPAALLVIAGDGELRESLAERVRALGLADSVLMPGYVTGDEKRRWLAAADAMALPSIVTDDGDAEGLPVALVEGLASGLACVATDVSGADEILADGADGFIVPQRDPPALARALGRALSMPPEERAALANRARAVASRFDWPVVAEATARHLLDFAGEASP
jgi:glycosyltransferase involved in cell wall biosynthesis